MNYCFHESKRRILHFHPLYEKSKSSLLKKISSDILFHEESLLRKISEKEAAQKIRITFSLL